MHVRFVALIFIALALLAVTTSVLGDRNKCECSGRRRWTQTCCAESRGFLRFERCHAEFSGRFIRCCEAQGLRGACFT